MFAKISGFIINLALKLGYSLKRFPVALAFATTTVFIAILINHTSALSQFREEVLIRLVMICALGIPLSLSLKVLFERLPQLKKSWQLLINVGALAVLVIYFLYLPKELNTVEMSRYLALTLSLYLAFAYIPYCFSKENFELYVLKLLGAFCITYIFAFVLFAGLSAMLFTVDKLFVLHLPGKVYFDIWLIVVGMFGPAFFLSDIPQRDAQFAEESYPSVLRVLLTWLVMPMLGVYTAILYAYFAKILVTSQWPEGIVAHLVLWYSIISTIVIFFSYSLRKRSQWVSSFLRIFPWLSLPLLGMMFVSLQIRIKAYGITESRYFVILAGIWVLGSMLYFILRKKRRNIVIVIALSILAVMAVLGSWSAYSVAKYSQNERFTAILQRNGMLAGGVLQKAAQTVPEKDQHELQSIINYFERTYTLKELRYLPADFSLKQSKDVLGFDLLQAKMYNGSVSYFNHNLQQNGEFLTMSGYDYFLDFTYYHYKDLPPSGSLHIAYQQNSKELQIIKQGQEIYQRNIANVALQIHQQNIGASNLPANSLTVTEENEDVKVTYLFKQINGRHDAERNEDTVESAEFYLFVKLLK